MTAKIVNMLGKEIEPTIKPKKGVKTAFWSKTIATALKAGAKYGVLIYVDDNGGTYYISIHSDRVAIRGLIEEVRDTFYES